MCGGLCAVSRVKYGAERVWFTACVVWCRRCCYRRHTRHADCKQSTYHALHRAYAVVYTQGIHWISYTADSMPKHARFSLSAVYVIGLNTHTQTLCLSLCLCISLSLTLALAHAQCAHTHRLSHTHKHTHTSMSELLMALFTQQVPQLSVSSVSLIQCVLTLIQCVLMCSGWQCCFKEKEEGD